LSPGLLLYEKDYFMSSAKKSLGLLFRLLVAGLVFHAVFSPASLLATDKASNLIKCPDCMKDVSRRAVHCPACGCPGDAISAEANRIDDARVLKPVVVITAPNGGGFGNCCGGRREIQFHF
jgi:hypothetical protein